MECTLAHWQVFTFPPLFERQRSWHFLTEALRPQTADLLHCLWQFLEPVADTACGPGCDAKGCDAVSSPDLSMLLRSNQTESSAHVAPRECLVLTNQ